jgi:uncharacterized protein (DUF927 family)
MTRADKLKHQEPIQTEKSREETKIKPKSPGTKLLRQASKKAKSPQTAADLTVVENENMPGEFEVHGNFTCIAGDALRAQYEGRYYEICEPLFVVGNCTDPEGKNSKVIFSFRNRVETNTTVAISTEDIDSPTQLLKLLKRAGFPMEAGGSNFQAKAIAQYVRVACQLKRTYIETLHDGWFVLPDGKVVYVLGAESYGAKSEKYAAYRINARAKPPFDKTKRDAWFALLRLLRADHLAVFGMCGALAAVLLGPLKLNAMMLYFVGSSSTGKTILLKLLASVFGSPEKLFTFSGTDNGIEANALAHRDKPFVIDEVGQATGRQFARLAYSITNGASKQRASSDGRAVAVEATRTVLIAAGEQSPQQQMANAGFDPKQGQDARLTVIPVGEQYGVWSTLGDFASGAVKSDYVAAQLDSIHGVAGRNFCKQIAPDIENILAEFPSVLPTLSETIQGDVVFAEGDGIPGRVLRQFSLIAFAGTLAVKKKILPWAEQDVLKAAEHCYGLWYAAHTAKRPAKQAELISPIRLFLESQRGSKFKPLNTWRDDHQGTVAGFDYHKRDGQEYFIFFPVFFESAFCSDVPKKAVLDALKLAGYLATALDGSPTVQIQMPGAGKGQKRSFYAIRKAILLG